MHKYMFLYSTLVFSVNLYVGILYFLSSAQIKNIRLLNFGKIQKIFMFLSQLLLVSFSCK